MSKAGYSTRNFALIITFIFVVAASNGSAGPSGTTISGTKTAAATITHTNTYSWAVQKITPTPSPPPYTIGLGSTLAVPFTITATQNTPTVTSNVGVPTGQICINNTGTSTTQGLYISDQLEQNISDNWMKIAGELSIPVTAEISSGQKQCYSYQFNNVSLNPQLSYRNHAIVSIDNSVGHEGTSSSIDLLAMVSFPQVVQNVDATATLTDSANCPSGLSCVSSVSNQLLTGSTSLSAPLTISNNSVCCGQTFDIVNNAILTPTTTGSSSSSAAAVQVFTGICPPCGSGTGFSINNVSDAHLVIEPGKTVIAGYNFKIPGSHPTTDLILLNGTVTIHVTCPDNTIQNVVIPLKLQTYTDPLNSSAWYPTSVQSDPAGFQGSAQVPSTLCGGQSGVATTGATFSGYFSSLPVGQCPNVRFHYQMKPIGAGANWSNTNVQVCGTCGPVCAPVN